MLRGAIEGEGLGRAVARQDRVTGRCLTARPARRKCTASTSASAPPRGLQDGGEPQVDPRLSSAAPSCARAASRMRSWNASSSCSSCCPRVRTTLPARSAARRGPLLLGGERRGLPGGAAVERLARHGDHLEQAPRLRGQAQEAVREDRSQPDAAVACAARRLRRGLALHVARELDHEERAPGRLRRDRVGLRDGPRAAAEEGQREGAPLLRGERADGQGAHVARVPVRVARGWREQAREELAPLGVLAPVAEEQQARGGVGLAEDVVEERGAVGVPPLEVVDGQDERPSIRDPREDLAGAANPRRRSSRASGGSISRRGAWAIASTRPSTGKRRTTAWTSRGMSSAASSLGRRERWRLSASIRLSTAL